MGGWNPGDANAISNGAWSKKDDHKDSGAGPEVCWDYEGRVVPLGLVDITEEEKEVPYGLHLLWLRSTDTYYSCSRTQLIHHLSHLLKTLARTMQEVMALSVVRLQSPRRMAAQMSMDRHHLLPILEIDDVRQAIRCLRAFPWLPTLVAADFLKMKRRQEHQPRLC